MRRNTLFVQKQHNKAIACRDSFNHYAEVMHQIQEERKHLPEAIQEQSSRLASFLAEHDGVFGFVPELFTHNTHPHQQPQPQPQPQMQMQPQMQPQPQPPPLMSFPASSQQPLEPMDLVPRSEELCAICQEHLGRRAMKLGCMHSFHEQCISEWAMHADYPSCPVCRSSLECVSCLDSLIGIDDAVAYTCSCSYCKDCATLLCSEGNMCAQHDVVLKRYRQN